jgi:hypothetical protein
VEPVYDCQVISTSETIGVSCEVLARRRAKVTAQDLKEGTLLCTSIGCCWRCCSPIFSSLPLLAVCQYNCNVTSFLTPTVVARLNVHVRHGRLNLCIDARGGVSDRVGAE